MFSNDDEHVARDLLDVHVPATDEYERFILELAVAIKLYRRLNEFYRLFPNI